MASLRYNVKDSFQELLPDEKAPFSDDLIRLLEKGLLANNSTIDRRTNNLSSLLMAFLVSDQLIGRWFDKYMQLHRSIDKLTETIRKQYPDYPDVQSIRNLTFGSIEIASSSEPQLNTYIKSASISVNKLFNDTRELVDLQQKTFLRSNTAQQQPTQVGSTKIKIELHHLMATLIFYPTSQDFDSKYISKLLFANENPNSLPGSYITLMNSFLTFIEDKNSTDFEFYVDQARGNGLSDYDPDNDIRRYFDSVKTTLIADTATLNDKFGYHSYAQAIGFFLMDKQTIPPITLSIQAPWGYGKSSMIEQLVEYLRPISSLTYKESPLKKQVEEQEVTNLYMTKEVLKSLQGGQTPDQLINSSVITSSDPPLVIRFNAWKYENSDQIWAGLMDTFLKV